MKRSPPTSRTTRAFTLVELLVVIGIIALLIAILLPSLNRAREQSNKVKCLANLRTVGHALFMYSDQHKGRLPNSNPFQTTDAAAPAETTYVLNELREQFLGGATGTFHCPSDRDDAPALIDNAYVNEPNSARISYDFYSPQWQPEFGPKLNRLKGVAPLAWDLNGGSIVDADPLRNHRQRGGNVLYADGHADWQVAKDWNRPNWPHPASKYYHQ